MKLFVVGAFLSPVLAFAGDGILGTKAGGGISTGISAGSGSPPLVQTLIAIAIVLILMKYGLPRLVRFAGVKSGSDGIRIEESATVGGGSVHVITTRGRTLLVGAGSGGFTTLADLTKPITTEPLFMDMVATAEPYTPASADLLARFDRLSPTDLS